MAKGLKREVVQFSRNSNYTDGAKYQFKAGQVGVIVETRDNNIRKIQIAYVQPSATDGKLEVATVWVYKDMDYVLLTGDLTVEQRSEFQLLQHLAKREFSVEQTEVKEGRK